MNPVVWVILAFLPFPSAGVLIELKHRTNFFSRRTLTQLVLYGLVGIYEWVAGYEILSHLPITGFVAFGIQSGIIGFTAFVMRKLMFERT